MGGGRRWRGRGEEKGRSSEEYERKRKGKREKREERKERRKGEEELEGGDGGGLTISFIKVLTFLPVSRAMPPSSFSGSSLTSQKSAL